MKVVSINADQTIGPEQIAFNVDEELTPEFIAKIDYGILNFSGSGTVLIVQLPADADTPFTAASVSTLNGKLKEIGDDFFRAAVKRRYMLQAIAQNTGLPLA